MKDKALLSLKRLYGIVIVALFALAGGNVPINAQADDMTIASGAGYKKPVTEVMAAFEKESSIHINGAFGNIQMISNQAKQSGDISCIIGDKKFLKRMTKVVQFARYQSIGKGILVLAYRQGVVLDKVEDIATDKIASLFMPQEKKAIYGGAGMEALRSYGYAESLKGKVTQVATVPQVVSYLLTGEADAGFINLTEALANKDKLGGYIVVPQEKYGTIEIVSGVVQGFEKQEKVERFVEFLAADAAKHIFAKYGVQ